MSIQTVGFTAFDTLFPQSILRVTIAENSSFDLLNQFSKGSAENVYNQLWPVARIIPTSRLAVVAGDTAAVIDANVKEEMQGSTLLYRLESIGTRFAAVSKVELLDAGARQESLSDDGQDARNQEARTATATANADTLSAHLKNVLGDLGTVSKFGVIALAAVAVLWLVGRNKG